MANPPPIPSPSLAKRFHAGGVVPADGFYVRRAADEQFLNALRSGRLCYILASRQIGKSSLRSRATGILRKEGFRCAVLNLQALSFPSEAEWYHGLIRRVIEDLELRFDETVFYQKHAGLSPPLLWDTFIREQVLAGHQNRTVFFIDEIDWVLHPEFKFSADAFFGSLRALFEEARSTDDNWRLTFALIGVTTPEELVKNRVRSPFNLDNVRIDLEDFSQQEMEVLAPGLQLVQGDAKAYLHAVFSWTGGHPYMTQRLCQRLAEQSPTASEAAVEAVQRLVASLFGRIALDPNLQFADAYLAHYSKSTDGGQLIPLYRRIFFGEQIEWDPQDLAHHRLLLSGLIKTQTIENHRLLTVRNRIFRECFGRSWIISHDTGSRWLVEKFLDYMEAPQSDRQLHVLNEYQCKQALTEASNNNQAIPPDIAAYIRDSQQYAEDRRQIEEKRRNLRRWAIRSIVVLMLLLLIIIGSLIVRNKELERKLIAEQFRVLDGIDKIEDAQRRILENEHSIFQLEGSLRVAESEIKKLQAEVKRNRERLADYRKTIKEQEKEISSLAGQISSVAGQNDELVRQNNKLSEKASNLEAAIGQLQAKLDQAIQTVSKRASVPPGVEPPPVLPPRAPELPPGGGAKTPEAIRELVASLREAWQRSKDPQVDPDKLQAAMVRLRTAVGASAFREYPRHLPPIIRLELRPGDKGYSVAIPCPSGDEAPGNAMALLGSTLGNVRLWDATGTPLSAPLPGQAGKILAAGVWGANCAQIMALTQNGFALEWQKASDRNRFRGDLKTVKNSMMAVPASKDAEEPNGTLPVVLAGSSSASLCRWQHANLKSCKSLPHEEAVTGVAISADGTTVATAAGRTIYLWDSDGDRTGTLEGHTDKVTALAFPNASKAVLVSASQDGTARRWDLASSKSNILRGHVGAVTAVAAWNKEGYVATGGTDRTLRLWDAKDGKLILVIPGSEVGAKVRSVGFSSEGNFLVVLLDSEQARLYRVGDKDFLSLACNIFAINAEEGKSVQDICKSL